MNRIKGKTSLLFTLCFLITTAAFGQLTAPGADASDKTSYPSFQDVDDIFIFCSEDSVVKAAGLTVSTALSGTKTFLWEQYNNQTGEFILYFSESTDNSTSNITGLESGCYRATISQGTNNEVYRAWVFNNWTIVKGDVTESNCDFFEMTATFTSAILTYYDLSTNSEVSLNKNIQVEWKEGAAIVSTLSSSQIYSPPTKDTDYTLRVYDNYNCNGIATVRYNSIVPKAAFNVDPKGGEAPLTVNFVNNSENGDASSYEWFFYRNLDDIKKEAENSDGPIDSIMIVAYDENPVYTYENSGTYDVKLVAKKVSEFHTCVDTAKIDDYIIVDTSFIAVPNVFTPNGDGTNDEFVVQFWSMQELEISIFNRWGKRIHYWESSDIRGFEGTWSETVWDGRLMGGRYASPGVYYYTAIGRGRDGERRREHGFFHLFRGKD